MQTWADTGIPAGDLDRRITIQVRTDTPDASGQPIPSWSTFVTCWAHYEPLTGAEKFAAMQWEAKTDSVFTIRYLTGLSTKMQILHDGRIWDITRVDEIGRRVGLRLYAYARSE